MSTSNRRPRRAALAPTDRIRQGLAQARRIVRLVKRGDEDMLARATLLQGVLSGDVVAASIHARQRMQRDILRLKTRLAHEHLRTEQVKRRLLEAQVETIEHADLTGTAIARIYEIYGLQPPREKPALPPADVTAVPAPLPSPPSQKSHADPSNPTDLSEIFL